MYSLFKFILSQVPQSSILIPLLFNVFLIDPFICLMNLDLDNFTDCNTITATCKNLDDP